MGGIGDGDMGGASSERGAKGRAVSATCQNLNFQYTPFSFCGIHEPRLAMSWKLKTYCSSSF